MEFQADQGPSSKHEPDPPKNFTPSAQRREHSGIQLTKFMAARQRFGAFEKLASGT